MSRQRVVLRKLDRIEYVLNGVLDYYNIDRQELCRTYKSPGKGDRQRIAIKLLRDVADCTYLDIALTIGKTFQNIQEKYSEVSEEMLSPTLYGKELQKTYKEILKNLLYETKIKQTA